MCNTYHTVPGRLSNSCITWLHSGETLLAGVQKMKFESWKDERGTLNVRYYLYWRIRVCQWIRVFQISDRRVPRVTTFIPGCLILHEMGLITSERKYLKVVVGDTAIDVIRSPDYDSMLGAEDLKANTA